MYVLYGGDFTRAPLVQWLLEEGEIEYEYRRVDILNGEHRSSAFLAINPAGLVPVLITPEGEALYEVAALMLYLADRHRLTHLAPQAADPDRGAFLSAMFHIAGDIQAEMKRFHFPHRYALREEDNSSIQDHAKSLIFGRLDVMNRRLASRGPYILGSRFGRFLLVFLDRLSRRGWRVRPMPTDGQSLRIGALASERQPISR
ncbi:glutathione S-transferase family protein [Ensifer sp. SSB1]|uniref:glutathione S-transferase family protein n=1 Tax=Ensifer sp. SSB1 TaxID=2795385 RepID=UPI0025C3A9AA|nr:glutathione S-transferase family protein [Ensifer sp. SSB1]